MNGDEPYPDASHLAKGTGKKASEALRVVIVDDEPSSIDALSFLIRDLPLPIQVVGTAQTLHAGIELIQTAKPDLVFLDVEIKDRLGFEVFNHISQVNFDVIFITGYSKYAIQAIKVSALDFLLKPVAKDELLAAILKKEQRDWHLQQKLETLTVNFQKQQLNRIAVPTLKGLEFTDVDDIQYCQAEDNYTQMFLNSGSMLLVSKTLKKLEELLDTHNFIRINRSTLINLNYLKSYVRGKSPAVILDNGKEFSLSPNRKSSFLKRINQL